MVVEAHGFVGERGDASGRPRADPVSGPWDGPQLGSRAAEPADQSGRLGLRRLQRRQPRDTPAGQDGERDAMPLQRLRQPRRLDRRLAARLRHGQQPGRPLDQGDSYNPVGGRSTSKLRIRDHRAFHLDADGSTLLNFGQRFGDSGTGSSREDTPASGPSSGGAACWSRRRHRPTRLRWARSSGPGHSRPNRARSSRRTGRPALRRSCWALMDYCGDAVGRGEQRHHDPCRPIEIFRWSHDFTASPTAGPGDVTLPYCDSGGTRLLLERVDLDHKFDRPEPAGRSRPGSARQDLRRRDKLHPVGQLRRRREPDRVRVDRQVVASKAFQLGRLLYRGRPAHRRVGSGTVLPLPARTALRGERPDHHPGRGGQPRH